MIQRQLYKILDYIIYGLHTIINTILNCILELILGPRKNVVKPRTIEQRTIITKGAVELAELIKSRELRSYDVVKAYYERMLDVNHDINAVIDGPFVEALEEARVVDERLERNEYSAEELRKKVFLGVPFTTKDSTSVKGKRLTFGLVHRKYERSEEDAECIRLMKEAGGIILATTNVPEACLFHETRNSLIGNTCNPYDLRRSAGGSSGGEGAVIGACATAFGIGSDLGGSLRIPALNCGIFSHKPTPNIINERGCNLRGPEWKETMFTVGPMARNVCDLKAMFTVIADPERLIKLNLNNPVNLKKLRFFYIPTNRMRKCTPVSDDLKNVMQNVCQHFQQLTGKQVHVAHLPHLEKSLELWRYWASQEPVNLKGELTQGGTVKPSVEFMKKIFGRSDYSIAAFYTFINNRVKLQNGEFMRRTTRELKYAFNNLLGDDGILFFHSSPRPAPFRYYPLVKLFDFNYTGIFNVLQVPSTQVPMGVNTDGIPLGLQVVSTAMNDRLCLAVAEEIERAFRCWSPPFSET